MLNKYFNIAIIGNFSFHLDVKLNAFAGKPSCKLQALVASSEWSLTSIIKYILHMKQAVSEVQALTYPINI